MQVTNKAYMFGEFRSTIDFFLSYPFSLGNTQTNLDEQIDPETFQAAGYWTVCYIKQITFLILLFHIKSDFNLLQTHCLNESFGIY